MNKINRHNYEGFYIDYLDGNLDAEKAAEMEAFLEANPDLAEELEGMEEMRLSPESHSFDKSGLKVPNLERFEEDQNQRDLLFYKAIEGEASPQELQVLDALVRNEEFSREYNLWKMAVVKPLESDKVSGLNLHRLPLELPVTASNFENFLIALSEGLLSEEEKRAVEEFAGQTKGGQRDLEFYQNLRLETPKGVFFPDKDQLKKRKKRVIWLRAAAIILLLTFLGSLSLFLGDDEMPVAEKREIHKDTAKAEIPLNTPSDTLPQKKQMDKIPLQEWEMIEPDPVEYAELPELKDESEIHAVEEINGREEIFPIEPLVAEVQLRPLNPSFAQPGKRDQPRKDQDEFLTIGEMAEKRLAKELNISEEDRDEMALAIAKKLTEKTGEFLDAEISKNENESNDYLTYSLRIGNFKVSHKTKK